MNKLKNLLFSDQGKDFGIFIIRVLFGIGMINHGYGKITGNMGQFALVVKAMGFPFPHFFAWAAALSEFVGGILLALGLFTRPAALFIVFTMGTAVFIRHGGDSFGAKELGICYLTVGVGLLISGGGHFSFETLMGWHPIGNQKKFKTG